MIRTVMMFANGNVACFDELGKQVAEWQRGLLCEHLEKMRDAGVITEDTMIGIPATSGMIQERAGDFIPWPKKPVDEITPH